MQNTTFKEAVCARYRCSPKRYAAKVFWRCLYWHALPVALLLRFVYPRFFHPDWQLIRDLEQARNISDVRIEIDNFASINRMHAHTIRNQLLLRVSGRKVMRFASKIFEQDPQAPQ